MWASVEKRLEKTESKSTRRTLDSLNRGKSNMNLGQNIKTESTSSFTGYQSSRMYTRYSLEVFLFLFVICCSLCIANGGNNKCQAFQGDKGNCAKEIGSVTSEDGGNGTISIVENSDSGVTKNWEIELTNGTGLLVHKLHDAITLQIARLSTSVEARKKRMKLMDVIPYLIIPGFISAGVLPWLIPGMKIAVMGVAMINQMAFTSSLFSLIRGYIFDTSQEDHIVYLNHGYEKYKQQKHPNSYLHR